MVQVVAKRNQNNRLLYYIVDRKGLKHRISKAAYVWVRANPNASQQKQLERLLEGRSVTVPRFSRFVSSKRVPRTHALRFPHRLSAGSLPSMYKKATTPKNTRALTRARPTIADFFKNVLQKVPVCKTSLPCSIPTERVRHLLHVLGIEHLNRRSRRLQKGRLPSDLSKTCTQLAVALGVASLPTRLHGKHKENAIAFMRPVRILGSGVAGFVFQLADGSVIKLAAIRNRPIAPRVDPIHPSEFLHEVRMMRHAHRVLAKSKINVPRYRAHRVLGSHRLGPDVGVIHMDAAPGEVFRKATFIKASKRAEKFATALASIHNAGMIHGDLHTGNAMIDRRGRVTILDWSRGQTVSWFRKRKLLPMYRELLARDVAFSAQSITSFRDPSIVQVFFDTYLKKCPSCIPPGTMHKIMADPYGYYKPRSMDIFDMLEIVEKE